MKCRTNGIINKMKKTYNGGIYGNITKLGLLPSTFSISKCFIHLTENYNKSKVLNMAMKMCG